MQSVIWLNTIGELKAKGDKMKITEHFTKEELIYSETAIRYKISNEPPLVHEGTLKHTCQYLLEPLRALLNTKYVGKVINGKTVKKVILNTTSAYRSSALNEKLAKLGKHPAKNSQHCTGEAWDGEVILVFTDNSRMVLDYKQFFKDIKNFVAQGSLSVDQCIQETDGSDKWVHISYSILGSTRNRKQFFEINL